MKAKDYLKQLKVYQVKIDQMNEEINNLKIIATGTGSLGNNPDKVQSSRSCEDKMADMVSRYSDMELEMQTVRWEYAKLRQKIISEIHLLTDSRYIQILYLHYVDNKRLEEIACSMTKANGDSYSFDHINALHGEALIEFEKKILNPIEIPSF